VDWITGLTLTNSGLWGSGSTSQSGVRIMKHSKETKRKISVAMKGKKKPWLSKRNKDPKFIEKMRRSLTGRKLSRKHRKSLSRVLRNKPKPWQIGEKNYFWQGGKSIEPYSVDWTETLKRSIRERDNYTCQLCGKPQGEKAHPVHHIDYNKKNQNPENLITLCLHCHNLTQTKRDYWTNYFNEKQRLRKSF